MHSSGNLYSGIVTKIRYGSWSTSCCKLKMFPNSRLLFYFFSRRLECSNFPHWELLFSSLDYEGRQTTYILIGVFSGLLVLGIVVTIVIVKVIKKRNRQMKNDTCKLHMYI